MTCCGRMSFRLNRRKGLILVAIVAFLLMLLNGTLLSRHNRLGGRITHNYPIRYYRKFQRKQSRPVLHSRFKTKLRINFPKTEYFPSNSGNEQKFAGEGSKNTNSQTLNKNLESNFSEGREVIEQFNAENSFLGLFEKFDQKPNVADTLKKGFFDEEEPRLKKFIRNPLLPFETNSNLSYSRLKRFLVPGVEGENLNYTTNVLKLNTLKDNVAISVKTLSKVDLDVQSRNHTHLPSITSHLSEKVESKMTSNRTTVYKNIIKSTVNSLGDISTVKNKVLATSLRGMFSNISLVTKHSFGPSLTSRLVNNSKDISNNQSKLNTTSKYDHRPTQRMQTNYAEPRFYLPNNSQFKFLNFVKRTEIQRNVEQSFDGTAFSVGDKLHLNMLFGAAIKEIYCVSGHEHVKIVSFALQGEVVPRELVPLESCTTCGVIKKKFDILEVFAFHLDRVLGINRAMPVVARQFTEEEIRQIDLRDLPDSIFPIMRFTPNLIHNGNFQSDQNSMELNWRQYQNILAGCHSDADDERCSLVDYLDWGRMAVFDFLLQNYDRLDRHCCGYSFNDDEKCFKKGIHDEIDNCDNWEKRFLVHIFITTDKPHQLVLIDNTFNIRRDPSRLNYDLLKGIKELPKVVMQNIFAADLGMRLLESLRHDSLFWETVGGVDIVQKLTNVILTRIQKLKEYIIKTEVRSVRKG